MESKQIYDAIQLYSYALSLLADNSVYYANGSATTAEIVNSCVSMTRAAAFTEIKVYNEAIEDCLDAIHCDRHYWKAYSRLGALYYAIGRYSDAIKRYKKGRHEIDPFFSITMDLRLGVHVLSNLISSAK
ncbi:hypothetical protein CDL15_Pgr003838 [Punica granatum]|uniref:Uncharacterized protein n=1 Tax=Punica granatum TaxID=22663 RepID=A0A218XUV8_PUNGR|nr:hypothetical protein CDL15_Pgr003838 [Punica granatum]